MLLAIFNVLSLRIGVILTLALKLQRRRAAYFQMKEWWFSALVRVHRLRASLTLSQKLATA